MIVIVSHDAWSRKAAQNDPCLSVLFGKVLSVLFEKNDPYCDFMKKQSLCHFHEWVLILLWNLEFIVIFRSVKAVGEIDYRDRPE